MRLSEVWEWDSILPQELSVRISRARTAGTYAEWSPNFSSPPGRGVSRIEETLPVRVALPSTLGSTGTASTKDKEKGPTLLGRPFVPLFPVTCSSAKSASSKHPLQ